MYLKILGVIFALALASCASNLPLSSAVQVTPAGAKLSFLDISKFDRDLLASFQAKATSVEVAFDDKASREAVISLERNSEGDVILSTIKFFKQS